MIPFTDRLKTASSDELAEQLDAARELIRTRRAAFEALHPRACKTCTGAGLHLNAPTPPAGTPDACADCTGATPARHPLDTSRQLSAKERATPNRHMDTSAAVILFTLAQVRDELEAELKARGWAIEGSDEDYCAGEDQ